MLLSSKNSQIYAKLTKSFMKKGELLVSIPRDHLFSTHTVLSHPKLGPIVRKSFQAQNGSPLSAMEVIIVGILFFKSNPSESAYWSRYLESVPTHYESLIFWPEEALLLLGIRKLALRVKKRLSKISALLEHTKRIVALLHDPSCIAQAKLLASLSMESFLWAYATVMSRSVFVKDASLWNSDLRLEKDIAALPPLLDFFNHSNETECTAGYNPSTQCYELRSEQSWQAGEQVFIKYGQHSNATLLVHYGFAITNNAYDSIDLELDFDQLIEGTVESAAKLTKLHQFGLIDVNGRPKSVKRTKHTLNEEGLGWNTMVAIKTVLIESKEEMARWDLLLEDAPISQHNETLYLQFCRSLYQSLLDQIEEGELHASSIQAETFHPFASSWATYLHLSSIYRSSCRNILSNALASTLN